MIKNPYFAAIQKFRNHEAFKWIVVENYLLISQHCGYLALYCSLYIITKNKELVFTIKSLHCDAEMSVKLSLVVTSSMLGF